MIEIDSIIETQQSIEMSVKMDGWHHIRVQSERGSLSLYIDGIQIINTYKWDENFTPPTEPYPEYMLPEELFEI